MRRKRIGAAHGRAWLIVVAAAAASFGGAHGAARAQSCTDTLPAACLQTLGAGAIAAAAADEGCGARLQSYRACIADIVEAHGAASGAAAAPFSRAEIGFLSALEAELADNVGRLELFLDRMDVTGGTSLYPDDWIVLRLRFFDATDNPAYFAAPADWLARTQAFYEDVSTLMAREDVRRVYRTGMTSTLYERRLAKEALADLVAVGRTRLLPEISAEIVAATR